MDLALKKLHPHPINWTEHATQTAMQAVESPNDINNKIAWKCTQITYHYQQQNYLKNVHKSPTKNMGPTN